MKLSYHAKQRMRERSEYGKNKEQKRFFKDALSKGKSPENIKDEKIKKYLLSIRHNSYVKLYENYVFIYSKNNKQLYTMYKLPNELLKERDD